MSGLLTVQGNAAFVILALQLVLKPLLDQYFSGSPWRALIINAFALVVAYVGAIVASLLLAIPLDMLLLLNLAMASAALAVAEYEVVKNVKRAFAK